MNTQVKFDSLQFDSIEVRVDGWPDRVLVIEHTPTLRGSLILDNIMSIEFEMALTEKEHKTIDEVRKQVVSRFIDELRDRIDTDLAEKYTPTNY